MIYVAVIYVVIGAVIFLTGVSAKRRGHVYLDWWAIALAALVWPLFIFVALRRR